MAAILVACLALAVLAAYGPVLDNFFLSIDDPLVVFCAARSESSTPHFRPLFELWNRGLFVAFGPEPAGWYACGLGLHALNAALVAALAHGLSRSFPTALAAGLACAVFYSPNEAVLMVAANCGLTSMTGVLVAALCWQRHLANGGAAWLVGAFACLVLAMGSKEDCVVAGPLFVALEIGAHGWRAPLRPRSLARYGAFAALGAGYLAVAFRPALWSESSEVGSFALGPALLPELLQNLAWLWWPGAARAGGWTAASVWAGAALVLALALVAWRQRIPTLGVGLSLLVFGLLPVLPGPFAIAGSRYAYPASLGAALVAGGLLGAAWERWPLRSARVALAGLFAAWLGVQVAAIRSVESWRFAPKAAQLQRLVESSRSLASEPDPLVLGPSIHSARDYRYALVNWLALDPERIELEWWPLEELRARVAAGADLDPRTLSLWSSTSGGQLYRVESAADAPWSRWEESAREHQARGLGRTVAALRIRG